MATHTPSDPAGTLKSAAENSGSFGTVEKEDPSQEYTSWPICVVDPTEDEDESTATDTNARIYSEEIDYMVHIASLRDQNSPRSTNDGLVDDFLDQLFADVGDTDESGRYEKVRRTRTTMEVGSDEVYLTTLVMRVTRNSRYF